MSAENADNGAFHELRADDRNAIWWIFREYGGGYRLEFTLGGIASLISRLLELVPALLLGIAVDSLLQEGPTSRQFSLPLIPQTWLPQTRWDQLVLITGLFIGAFVLSAVLSWANSWAWNRFAQHLQHEVRTDTYDAMQSLGLEFFDTKQTGEVMSILNNDVNQLEDFLTNHLNGGIRIVVWVAGAGVVMLLLNWQLALIPVLLIPLLGGVSYGFVRRIHPKYQKVRSAVGALNSRLETNLGGIMVVKSYNREAFESQRVADASESYLTSQWNAISTRIKFFPSLQVITAAGYVGTFFVGAYWVIRGPVGPLTGSLSAGTLVTFLLYSRRFMWPMRQFGQILNSLQYAEAAAERIVGLMDEPRTIREDSDAYDLVDVAGRIEYEDVSFHYSAEDAAGPENDSAISTVNFTVEPGEYVGLVGPTGAGKTTLLKLLMRMYDVDEGTIRVDGTDIRDVTLDSLRSSVGYVSQEPFLFYGTVKENIAYGRPEISDERIREVAVMAGAHEFVRELPKGYDTMVGERGVKLSGGQRQRISIARALLKDPEILILDEATSHVDNETEMLIQNSLEELVADRTTFAIAHRLSTVRNADEILVLDEGQLVEQGTHEHLLQVDGLYANLWRVQVGEVENLPQEFVEQVLHRQASQENTD